MFIKAIIFDLDGTLLDTLEDIANAANTVLSRHKFPTYHLDDYRYFVGSGAAELIKRTLPEDRRTNELIQKCIGEFLEAYHLHWNIHTRPYEGIPELLNELKNRQLKLAVHSNKPDLFTQMCIRELLPNSRFDIILGESSRIPRKPDPAGANQIARWLNVTNDHILYVGDTVIDMETAITAGMFPVGVLWGFRTKEELEKNGARALVRQPQEIITLLDNPVGKDSNHFKTI